MSKVKDNREAFKLSLKRKNDELYNDLIMDETDNRNISSLLRQLHNQAINKTKEGEFKPDELKVEYDKEEIINKIENEINKIDNILSKELVSVRYKNFYIKSDTARPVVFTENIFSLTIKNNWNIIVNYINNPKINIQIKNKLKNDLYKLEDKFKSLYALYYEALNIVYEPLKNINKKDFEEINNIKFDIINRLYYHAAIIRSILEYYRYGNFNLINNDLIKSNIEKIKRDIKYNFENDKIFNYISNILDLLGVPSYDIIKSKSTSEVVDIKYEINNLKKKIEEFKPYNKNDNNRIVSGFKNFREYNIFDGFIDYFYEKYNKNDIIEAINGLIGNLKRKFYSPGLYEYNKNDIDILVNDLKRDLKPDFSENIDLIYNFSIALLNLYYIDIKKPLVEIQQEQPTEEEIILEEEQPEEQPEEQTGQGIKRNKSYFFGDNIRFNW